MLSAAGCGGDPTETTPSSESTPVATPEESTPAATPEESTPAATPEESTPEPLTYYSISYDLGGGIDGGNPTVYNGEESLKLIIPIRPGYDFVGWTGTGIETPTVSVNIPQGSSGDLTFTAHWVENTDFEVIIDKTTKDILGQTYYQLVKFILVKSDTANDVNEQVARDLQAFFDENKTIVKITTDRHRHCVHLRRKLHFTCTDKSCTERYSRTVRFFIAKHGCNALFGQPVLRGANDTVVC